MFINAAKLLQYINLCKTVGIIVPFFTDTNLTVVHSNKFENLSGETVVFECMPSPPNIELFWTYQTNNGYGSVTIDTISQSRFLSESSLFHQLILPIATAGDTGNYSCVVRGLPGVNISKPIEVTISPGKLLW